MPVAPRTSRDAKAPARFSPISAGTRPRRSNQRSHHDPRSRHAREPPREPGAIDRQKLSACIEACYECAQTCTACADACLGEQNIAELPTCIRTNLDCADVCGTTGRVLSRHTGADTDLTRAILWLCAAACKACGDECVTHAEMGMPHCQVCAEACRRCEQVCRAALAGL